MSAVAAESYAIWCLHYVAPRSIVIPDDGPGVPRVAGLVKYPYALAWV